jgi:protein phosphatase
MRTLNEDSFLVVELPDAPDTLLAVADGIGGREAGEVASYFALRLLLQERLQRSAADPVRTAGELGKVLMRGLRRANYLLSAVNRQLGAEGFLMGTTVVVLAFVDLEAVLLHAGDSRCYQLRDGQLRQLTRDDTWAETLIQEGALSRSEAVQHPWAQTLCNCLGVAPEVRLSLQWPDCRPGDRFLICTDGVFQMLSEAEIADCLEAGVTAAESASAVIRQSLRHGGRDNITAGVALIQSGPRRR